MWDLVVTPACLSIFDCFQSVGPSPLTKPVQQLQPSHGPLNVFPPRLFKEVLNTLGPYVCDLINSSLMSGCVKAAFKHAFIQPLLKKNNLDPTVLSNFRPIPKLPFLAKILEKVVHEQLQSYFKLNKITEKFQSGFKSCHSTETALLKVLSDLYLTVDSKKNAVLILLDLTAAFDTVDHSILLSRLESCVGIRGNVLKWFASYLTDRSFSVQLEQHSSKTVP